MINLRKIKATPKSKKADIWVQVIIYTLVGLTAIGILLMAMQPRIKEARDRITIKQTIEALHNFDSAIRSTLVAPGNKRQVEFKLSEGDLVINPSTKPNVIEWTMKSSTKYSEPGIPITEGSIKVLTQKADPYTVTLSLTYVGVAQITFDGQPVTKTITKSGKPNVLVVENLGVSGGTPGSLPQVNIKISQ